MFTVANAFTKLSVVQPVMLIHLHIVGPIGPNVCRLGFVLDCHLKFIVKSEYEASPIEAKVVEAEP